MGSIEEYWKNKYRHYWRLFTTLCLLLAVALFALMGNIHMRSPFMLVDILAIGVCLSQMERVLRKIQKMNKNRPPGV